MIRFVPFRFFLMLAFLSSLIPHEAVAEHFPCLSDAEVIAYRRALAKDGIRLLTGPEGARFIKDCGKDPTKVIGLQNKNVIACAHANPPRTIILHEHLHYKHRIAGIEFRPSLDLGLSRSAFNAVTEFNAELEVIRDLKKLHWKNMTEAEKFLQLAALNEKYKLAKMTAGIPFSSEMGEISAQYSAMCRDPSLRKAMSEMMTQVSPPGPRKRSIWSRDISTPVLSAAGRQMAPIANYVGRVPGVNATGRFTARVGGRASGALGPFVVADTTTRTIHEYIDARNGNLELAQEMDDLASKLYFEEGGWRGKQGSELLICGVITVLPKKILGKIGDGIDYMTPEPVSRTVAKATRRIGLLRANSAFSRAINEQARFNRRTGSTHKYTPFPNAVGLEQFLNWLAR